MLSPWGESEMPDASARFTESPVKTLSQVDQSLAASRSIANCVILRWSPSTQASRETQGADPFPYPRD